MNRLRLGTRITLWSAMVVALVLLISGVISTLYVHRQERIEFDRQLAAEAKHIFSEWRHHGGPNFDWATGEKEVSQWMPVSESRRMVEVTDARNHVVYRSKSLSDDLLHGISSGFHNITSGDDSWRVGVFRQDGMTLRIAGDLEAVNDLVEELATAFLITLPIALILAIFGARLIAHKAVSPIQKITDFAERITVHNLGERVPLPPARDEIHRMAVVLNRTFDRLEQSFHQATRFSADASHELKTPLTVLRASVEALLRSPKLDLDTQQGLSCILEDTKRLSLITESLLLLSRADAGKLTLELVENDLAETVGFCADDASIIMEEKRVHMERELPAVARARFDKSRLSQILMNLFDNALKYNRPDGTVRVALTANGATWNLSIANTGPGIASADVPRLFTRFFRGEFSREVSGHGLGLSLSRELARAHRGDLVLGKSEEGWTTFILTLPKVERGAAG
jgi:signal transduction histidine kinase